VAEAAWIDNGPGWLGVLLRDAGAVLAVEHDVTPRAGQQSIGVAGLYGEGADSVIEVRAFFNDGGGPLREDPVTGSLNASV
jgi:predicted PhzF superfamily epimerase YddE/YHI9